MDKEAIVLKENGIFFLSKKTTLTYTKATTQVIINAVGCIRDEIAKNIANK